MKKLLLLCSLLAAPCFADPKQEVLCRVIEQAAIVSSTAYKMGKTEAQAYALIVKEVGDIHNLFFKINETIYKPDNRVVVETMTPKALGAMMFESCNKD